MEDVTRGRRMCMAWSSKLLSFEFVFGLGQSHCPKKETVTYATRDV